MKKSRSALIVEMGCISPLTGGVLTVDGSHKFIFAKGTPHRYDKVLGCDCMFCINCEIATACKWFDANRWEVE